MKKILIIVILVSVVCLTFTGCSKSTQASQPIQTESTTEVEKSLEIIDVSVSTSSYLGQIQYGMHPERWKSAEIGKVAIVVKTSQLTRISYSIEAVSEDDIPAGYSQSSGRLSASNDTEYYTIHNISADDLCPYASYKYEIYCTNKDGQQVSYSGTFFPR